MGERRGLVSMGKVLGGCYCGFLRRGRDWGGDWGGDLMGQVVD